VAIIETQTTEQEPPQGMALSWHGQSLAWQGSAGAVAVHDCDDVCITDVPVLPDETMPLARVYVPMECLLVRCVQLPLQQVQWVDAAVLLQEISEQCDIQAQDWWLSWAMQSCEAGVAGMVFGLPESLRQSMQASKPWCDVPEVLVDGFERLQMHIVPNQACAVLDGDDEGVFLGYFDGQTWRGMRRLNMSCEDDWQGGVWAQVLASWQAMGFDAEKDLVLGNAFEAWVESIQGACKHWQGQVLPAGRSRHQANLALHTAAALNLRHGRWAVRGQGRMVWKQWKRSAILLGLTYFVWLLGMVFGIQGMNHKLQDYEQRMEQAFHQGLPQEPVMLDALAQLRKASGGSSQHDVSFLLALQAVAQVYQKQSWQLQSLELRDGEIYMAGKVANLERLNQLQAALQQALGKSVRLDDTNLSGEQVAFRMHW